MNRKLVSLAVVVLVCAGLLGLWFVDGERGRGAFSGEGATDLVRPPESLLESSLDLPARTAPLEGADEVLGSRVEPSKPSAAHLFAVRVRIDSRETGEPLAGARVTVLEGDGSMVRTTDAQGLCRLLVAASNTQPGPVPLLVEKAGFFHVRANYDRREELEISLAPAVELVGRVLAADTGRAVPGARVTFVHSWCKGCAPEVVVAGPDGSYALAAVPWRSPLDLNLEAEGFPEQYRRFEVREEGPSVVVDLRMERGLFLQGFVVDAESGAGIPGAQVNGIVAGASGSFAGRILPESGAEQLELEVRAPGYCRLRARVKAEEPAEPLEFRLPRVTIVAGRVLDARGEPVGAAGRAGLRLTQVRSAEEQFRTHPELRARPAVEGLPEGWRIEAENEFVRADAEGEFRLEAVPWARHQELRASDDTRTTSRWIEELAGPGEVTSIDLVLPDPEPSVPVCLVVGEVLLNGTPLTRARGTLVWRGPTRSGTGVVLSGEYGLEAESGELHIQARIEGLPEGIEGASFTLEVEQGANVDHPLDLRLPMCPIRGHVRFDDGAAVPGVTVHASRASSGAGEGYWERLDFTGECDGEGSYRIEVPDDTAGDTAYYRVEAALHGAEARREGIRPGSDGVDLVLPRAGTLLFRYREAKSEVCPAATSFELAWRRPGEHAFRSVNLDWPIAPDPEGWIETQLPVGTLELRAAETQGIHGFSPCLVQGVELRRDVATRVLARGPELVLQLAPGTPPLPGEHVLCLVESEFWPDLQHDVAHNSWSNGAPGSGRSVRFDETGTARLRGLAPGVLRSKVFPPDLRIEPETVELGEEPGEPVVVRWSKVP